MQHSPVIWDEERMFIDPEAKQVDLIRTLQKDRDRFQQKRAAFEKVVRESEDPGFVENAQKRVEKFKRMSNRAKDRIEALQNA